MLASNRLITRRGLLSSILIASLLLVVGNQMFRAQQANTLDLTALSERLSIEFDVEANQLAVSGWASGELDQLQHFVDARADWSTYLPIYINLPDYEIGDLPAVLGSYHISNGGETLTFQPDYGWSQGQHYIVAAQLDAIAQITAANGQTNTTLIELPFYIPNAAVPQAPPIITNIYPTSDELPENLLRFYIEFSQPMQRGDAYDLIYLLDENGIEVEWPFLRIGQEFWDLQMQTLTIIMDPGRIKQGVAPNLEAGAPLAAESSGSYELVIDRGLMDAYGRTVAETVRKSFTVVAPDQQSPDPTNWSLSLPPTATHDPLVVALDDAIDPILATSLIRLEDNDGRSIPSVITLDDNETMLSITPVEPWSSGMYRLAVSPTLEDYAGNRVESLFDMASGTVAALAATTDERDPIYIEFNIGTDGM